MSETNIPPGLPAAARILAAATTLFARSGYNSVSTREIASAAMVNEITVFRHFPRKRDLYLAVMRSGLEEVQLRGDLLSAIAEASDGRVALAKTLELITKTLTKKPETLRLFQFSALELGADFEPLARKHLNEFVELIGRYLDPWIEKGELHCTDGKTMVFTLVGMVVSFSSLQHMFLIGADGQAKTFEACAELFTNPLNRSGSKHLSASISDREENAGKQPLSRIASDHRALKRGLGERHCTRVRDALSTMAASDAVFLDIL